MNAKNILIYIFLLSFAIHVNGQLNVDAGKDTTLCMSKEILQLGGNPTASGGKEPYIFKWELMPVYDENYRIPASEILNDSTSANPIIDSFSAINDTITLVLTVTDADFNSKKDSVNVIISSIAIIHLSYLHSSINQGDSVLLKPQNVFNGISPFFYSWTPETGLSNPIIRNPYAKPDTSIRYTCLVTDALGCSSRDNYDVKVIPTGISELSNSTYYSSVYPNPIDLNSIIKTFNPLNEKRKIKVLNLNGQVLFEDWFYSDIYDIGKKINQDGLYFFRIRNDREILATGKFIKK
jgi:hypothetical protein